MECTKMKIKKLLLCVIINICSISLISCSSPGNISDTTLQIQADDPVVYGANGWGDSYSINESGILYGKDNTLRYYDINAGESYILCGKANCAHSDDECGAWFDNVESVAGIALYNGKIYLSKKNPQKNTFDLISMNATGEEQKTLMSLEIGNVQNNSWVLASIEDTYYCSDYAIVGLNYNYVEDSLSQAENINCKQYLIVDLSSGETTAINERTKDSIEYKLVGVSEKNILFRKLSNEVSKFSETEFVQKYKDGDFKSESFFSNDLEQSYFDYVNKWYPANCKRTETYCYYDLESKKEIILEATDAKITYDENGYQTGELAKYLIIGTYNDNYLVSEPDWENRSESISLWDIYNNHKTNILVLENGGTLAWEKGSAGLNIFDNGKFLYCIYKEGGEAEVHLYDLDSNKDQYLFSDNANISFRIIDDTQEFFIGKIYTDFGYEVYKIRKDDYYRGYVDKAVQINL